MDAVRAAMVEVGRRLWTRGFVAANDGNLSVRIGEGRFLTTATGSIKGFLQADDLVLVDASGRTLPESISRRAASSEVQMHLAIYDARPDVEAVVHAHPATATGFATAGIALEGCVLPEIVATLGSVPTVPYGTPSTPELSEAVRRHAGKGHALLLANHGAVTFAGDLFEAYYHMERVEHYARILLTARQLGNVQHLTDAQVRRLHDAIGGRPEPACAACGEAVAEGVSHTCVPERTQGPPRTSEVDEDTIERIAHAVRSAMGKERADGSRTRG